MPLLYGNKPPIKMIKELKDLVDKCNEEVKKCVKNQQTQGQTERNINKIFNNYWMSKSKQKHGT